MLGSFLGSLLGGGFFLWSFGVPLLGTLLGLRLLVLGISAVPNLGAPLGCLLWLLGFFLGHLASAGLKLRFSLGVVLGSDSCSGGATDVSALDCGLGSALWWVLGVFINCSFVCLVLPGFILGCPFGGGLLLVVHFGVVSSTVGCPNGLFLVSLFCLRRRVLVFFVLADFRAGCCLVLSVRYVLGVLNGLGWLLLCCNFGVLDAMLGRSVGLACASVVFRLIEVPVCI